MGCLINNTLVSVPNNKEHKSDAVRASYFPVAALTATRVQPVLVSGLDERMQSDVPLLVLIVTREVSSAPRSAPERGKKYLLAQFEPVYGFVSRKKCISKKQEGSVTKWTPARA